MMKLKLYKFYNRPSDEVRETYSNSSIDELYTLEAFTNKKSLRNEFKKERDMSKYIEIKDEVEKSEYIEFANQNNGQRLDYYMYSHKKYDSHGITYEEVPILSTWFERDVVESYEEDVFDTTLFRLFPLVFKAKYLEALSTLSYMALWGLMTGRSEYAHLMTEQEINDIDELVYSLDGVGYDRFVLFIDLYGSKFK